MNDTARTDELAQPYAPSWVDRFTDWADWLPGPRGSFYLGVWLVLVFVQVGTLWLEGAFPIGTVFPAQLFIPAMICVFLAMVPFLDSRAEAALATLRPALKATEDECSQLRYQLTTLPGLPTLLASAATVVGIYLLGVVTGERESSIEALATSPVAANLLLLMYYVGWWHFGGFLYHTVHQLRVINHIYTEHTRVSLFALSPLYAFSSVTALTAVILAIATYGWTALNPDNLSDPVSMVAFFLITALALVVFAWPLLGAHRLVDDEKDRLMGECSSRLEAAIVELHRRMDSGELEGMGEFNMAMASLEIEHNALNRIPTWPWEPETLSLLITALALPLGLWILQYVLQQMLGS